VRLAVVRRINTTVQVAITAVVLNQVTVLNCPDTDVIIMHIIIAGCAVAAQADSAIGRICVGMTPHLVIADVAIGGVDTALTIVIDRIITHLHAGTVAFTVDSKPVG